MLNLGSKKFVQNFNIYVLASQNKTIFSRNKIVKTLK